MLIKKKTYKTFVLPLSIFASALLFLEACTTSSAKSVSDRDSYTIPDSLLKTLSIDSVKQGELLNVITLTGQVDFNQDKQVNLFPLVSGNIEDIKVQLGDYVYSGQTIAIIRSSEMAGYSNNLIVAETNLTGMKKQLDAAQDLYKSGLASQIDVTNAQVNYDQAISQLEMAKRILKINGSNTQGEYIIKAPINGFIVQKFVTNDQVIRADNGNAMFTISDLKNVWVWANVYESNLDKVHLGDQVTVTTLSYPDRIFKGSIDKIMHVLDPSSKVTKVRVVINNLDYALRPQMFASVTVTNTQHKQALYVPSSSVIFDHSQYYVLVYRGDGKADITPVTPIARLSSLSPKVYLAEGVQADEKIIASNTLQIYDQLNN
ncbi:MAG: efflux RND transporter periplasmic adaptor subunit [Bacteroidetes bacterium]|nr:efflux RND transporter periplasmic adaptor subunit [Bacteroidota bacterium]